MDLRSVRIALSLVALLAALLTIFACNSTPDANSTVVESEAELSKGGSNDPCRGTNDSNRVSTLQTYLSNSSMDDNDLNGQRSSNNFKFLAEPYNTSGTRLKILVRVQGRVIGQDDDNNNKPPKMKNFLKFLEKGMRKGCIDRVAFEPMPAPTPIPGSSPLVPPPAVTSSVGFEWQTCMHPEFPCDLGRCSSGQVCVGDSKGSPSPSPAPSSSPKP